jgi:hypothetical protein
MFSGHALVLGDHRPLRSTTFPSTVDGSAIVCIGVSPELSE